MDYLKTFKKEKDGLDFAEDSFVNEEHELWVLCWCINVNLSLSKLHICSACACACDPTKKLYSEFYDGNLSLLIFFNLLHYFLIYSKTHNFNPHVWTREIWLSIQNTSLSDHLIWKWRNVTIYKIELTK